MFSFAGETLESLGYLKLEKEEYRDKEEVEVKNISTTIQWSLQTHVRDHLAKQFATLSVSELLVPPVTQLTKYQAW